MKVICPWCKTEHEADDSFIGQQVECECGKEFIVPIPPSHKITFSQRLSDIFHSKKLRAELEEQKSFIEEFKLNEPIEHIKLVNKKINNADFILYQKNNQLDEINTKIGKAENQLTLLKDQIQKSQNDFADIKAEIQMRDFGLFEPKYSLISSADYLNQLKEIRNKQKELIVEDRAITGNTQWKINESSSQGSKMISDMKKLLLRAFNSECEFIIDHVTYSNYEASYNRILKSCDSISRLGKVLHIQITENYRILKIDELRLAYNYQERKQQEKDEQKAIRAQMREEAKVQHEIEVAKQKLEKEQFHYQNALLKLQIQINNANDIERENLMTKKEEIETKLTDIDVSFKDLDYREANQRAGYVYVISNIGSFGEDVYKIGMTRRLDPTERIDELSDASVPFNFDIHAMIFTSDAPALESALHKAFHNKKMNWVNTRREFFQVTLDEIKDVVKNNHEKTAEFIDVALADQFRISEDMKKQAWHE